VLKVTYQGFCRMVHQWAISTVFIHLWSSTKEIRKSGRNKLLKIGHRAISGSLNQKFLELQVPLS
jgi:hypothetical protein